MRSAIAGRRRFRCTDPTRGRAFPERSRGTGRVVRSVRSVEDRVRHSDRTTPAHRAAPRRVRSTPRERQGGASSPSPGEGGCGDETYGQEQPQDRSNQCPRDDVPLRCAAVRQREDIGSAIPAPSAVTAAKAGERRVGSVMVASSQQTLLPTRRDPSLACSARGNHRNSAVDGTTSLSSRQGPRCSRSDITSSRAAALAGTPTDTHPPR